MPTKNDTLGGQKKLSEDSKKEQKPQKQLSEKEQQLLNELGKGKDKKEKHTGKKVAIAVASALLAATTLTIPAVIYYTQNRGYEIKIEVVGENLDVHEQTLKLKKGATIGDIQAPNRPGYYFAGFYSDKMLSKKLSADTKITKETTIYLHYILIGYEFANADEYDQVEIQDLSGNKLDTSKELHHGDKFAVKITTRKGYDATFSITGAEFTNEYTQNNLPIYVINADNKTADNKKITLIYSEEIQTFTVHFFDQDGSELSYYPAKDNIPYDTTIQVNDPTKDPTVAEQYHFEGWLIVDENNQQLGEDKQYFKFGETTITGDLYVQAEFTASPREYTLTIDAEDRSHVTIKRGQDDITELTTIHYGEELTISYTCDEGYHCNEFTINEVDHKENNVTHTVNGNVTITFEQEINTYTVHFFDQDGEKLANYEDKKVQHNNKLQVDNPTKEQTDAETYTFKDWLIVDKSNKPILQDGENQYFNFEETAITGDLYVQAEFTASPREYTLTIDADYINYVTVMRGEDNITNQTSVFYGDKLAISYQLKDGFCFDISVSGATFDNETGLYTVTGNVTVVYTETSATLDKLNFTLVDNHYKVDMKDKSISGEVIIPEQYQNKPVEEIGSFPNCTSITKLEIPNSITTIAKNAFTDCSGLTSISIGKNVTQIGNSAFQNCTALTEINFNAINCADLTYSYWFTDAGQNGEGIKLTIGNEVTKIPAYFLYAGSVTRSPKIISVKMGENVKSIGDYAFSGCGKFTEIVLPETLTSIGKNSFTNCEGLTSINIPKNVKSIGDYAFSGCLSLTQIYFNAINMDDLSSNTHYIFVRNGENADGLSVVFGDDVQHIPANLFYNSTDSNTLKSITIGKNVQSIGKDAFSYCKDLSKIIYKAKNCADLSDSIVDNPFDSACTNNGAVVKISDDVETIPTNLFRSAKITQLTLGKNVTKIGDGAFYSCQYLETVDLSKANKLTTVGSYAFYYCTKVKALDFSNTKITTIMDNAFYNCSKLETINLPNSVSAIGAYAFASCSALTEFTIPEKLTVIENNLLSGCTSLTSLTIPKNIVSIGDNAFNGLKVQTIDLTQAVNLQTIGTYAFRACGITSMVIPNNVTSIGEAAFYNCTDLQSIVLPESLTTIGEYAFEKCTSLKEVFIPKNVANIGIGILSGCTSVKTITVDNASKYFTSRDKSGVECNIIIRLSDGKLVQACNNSVIPNDGSILGLEGAAFEGCDKLSGTIIVPEGTTSIDEYTFNGCAEITNVILPTSLQTINEYAFKNCKNLKTLDLSHLTNLTTIGEYAFEYCENLSSIIFPESLTTIETYAFHGCNLQSIYLPKNVAEIGVAAFEDCKLSSIVVDDANQFLSSKNNSGEQCNIIIRLSDKTIVQGCDTSTIPTDGSVTSIGSRAFAGRSLVEITIPESTTSIGDYAFANCKNLTKIYYNATNCANLNSSGYAFQNAGQNSDGVAVIIGDNVTQIPEYLFYASSSYNSNITSITLGKEVSSIGKYAFYYLQHLKTVDFSKATNLTTIGNYAFGSCKELTNISLPNSITTIGEYAFNNCSALTSVTIPENVTSFGRYAFENCKKLTQINYNARNVADFSSTQQTPFRCAGQEGEGISVVIGDAVEHIPAYLLYNSTSSYRPKITSITIGENVTSMGIYALRDCSEVKTIIFNAPNVTIESNKHVFSGTSGSVTFGDKVTAVPAYLFYNSNITSVTLGKNITEIGKQSFMSCSELTTVTIGSGVTSIDNYAFQNCKNLVNVTIDSKDVYNKATGTDTSHCGGLLTHATKVRVLKTIVDDEENNSNTYLNGTGFTKTDDADGQYYLFTKK